MAEACDGEDMWMRGANEFNHVPKTTTIYLDEGFLNTQFVTSTNQSEINPFLPGFF